ncbi:MAG TPA: hypothetical protein VFO16_17165 [Pseudonocardiaceae bacterium]|nr:hypothetical protein [Pseudonocardiaceae bacterium]
MSAQSPLDDAMELLDQDLLLHLDQADELATQIREWSEQDMDSARKVIGDLVLIIRGLLVEHEWQPGNECRICARAWPCPVATTIHAFLKDPDREFVTLIHRVRG